MSDTAAGSNRLNDSETKVDTLATGLMFMLALTVGQRGIGFLRSILFCGVLQDDQLGRWSLAFSFLSLAGPLVVLGIPGSFGRYVEHFRQRGQLGPFLRRTTAVSLVLVALAAALAMMTAPTWAFVVFGDASLAPMFRLLIITLLAVIASNFAAELLTAMRQVRAVSIMQFTTSLMFAILAVILLTCTPLREEAVIIAFGVSSLVATLVVIGPLRRVGRGAKEGEAPLAQGHLWRKLLPFAAWMWLINILANLFDAADRFMLIHFARDGFASAESLVGQYHASRVVPFLLVGVAGMVAGVILPYMSHDWETGRRRSVSLHQRLSIKLGSLVMTALGALILLGAPILFTWILRGKYDQGLTVLPWTLTYCIWFSLMTLAVNYLWCAEKARLGSLALFLGLIVNVGLNMILVPRLGLLGAVLATAAANAVALGLVVYFSRILGLAVDIGVMVSCGLPVLLVFGPLPAMAALLACWLVAMRYSWLLDENEKQACLEVVDRYWNRIRKLMARRRVASA